MPGPNISRACGAAGRKTTEENSSRLCRPSSSLPLSLNSYSSSLAHLEGHSRATTAGSPIVDGPEVYEDRDSAQREAEGPRASMDYSQFDTKKTQIERARIRAIRESNCTSVTRTGQRTPPTVCCWTSPIPSPSPSPSPSLAEVTP